MKTTKTPKRDTVSAAGNPVRVDWKRIAVRVPPEVHRALRIRAAEEGRSCAVIVEELVRQYLVGEKRGGRRA